MKVFVWALGLTEICPAPSLECWEFSGDPVPQAAKCPHISRLPSTRAATSGHQGGDLGSPGTRTSRKPWASAVSKGMQGRGANKGPQAVSQAPDYNAGTQKLDAPPLWTQCGSGSLLRLSPWNRPSAALRPTKGEFLGRRTCSMGAMELSGGCQQLGVMLLSMVCACACPRACVSVYRWVCMSVCV